MGSPKKFEVPHHYPFLVNLNLDEFIIGKPLNYNLDELVIKNVISAQECHMMQNPSSSSSSSSSPPIFHGNPNTTLAKNTIDDVWNDIVCQKQMKNPAEMSSSSTEFRLEEYMIRNNQEDFLQNSSVPLMAKIDQEFRDWRQQEMVHFPMHQVQAIVGSNFQVSENNRMMDFGYLETQLRMSEPTTQVAQTKSSDSKGETEKKRDFTDERMAKKIERRRRRMIKNRESAARSRARKQAYINQLQHNVLQLQTTNNWLRKRKELITLLNSSSISGPRYQLRRNSSTEF